MLCALSGGFAATTFWHQTNVADLQDVEAGVSKLQSALATQRSTLLADLQASEAMRLRLEERVTPAAGVTDQAIDVDDAARLAGLDRQRVPADAPTWSLDRIDFDPASDRFSPDAYPELAKLGILVQLCPTGVIELGGGTGGADPQLAKLRRERVRDFLLQHFEVEAERITIATADEPVPHEPLLVRIRH